MPGTVLPEYEGLGLANVVPAIERHFGLETPIPGLSAQALPPDLLDGVERVVTLLVDALGYEQLTAAMDAGRAPRLSALRERDGASFTTLTSTFPSTTVTALITLGTGLPPGQHGVINQVFYDASLGTVVDMLPFAARFAGRGLDKVGVDPGKWLGLPTVHEQLGALGVASTVVNHAEFEGTSLSVINHRGAGFVPFRTLSDLCVNLRAAVEAAEPPACVHAYWGMLDAITHAYGTGSPQHAAEIEVLDHAIGEILLRDLRSPGTLLLLLADHGHINSPPERRLWLNDHPHLLSLCTSPPGGIPRATLLYIRAGLEAEAMEYVQAHLAEQVHVLMAEESILMGLYGPWPFSPVTPGRIGQLLLLPKENWTLKFAYPGAERKPGTTGKHGGLTTQEMLVPLLALRLD